jgi:uracil-DNA glycosylase family 4
VNPEDILNEVSSEVSSCTLCELHHSRKNAVPGEGPVNSEIMFIGEGPGFHENEQGKPFVGAAGKFLEELLSKIGLKREEVFITNVVKCRPPKNRDPQPEEVDTCTKTYLDRQIQAINPKVIVTLGRFSMNLFIPNVKISNVHGKPVQIKDRLVVPMYHPAAALHQGSLRPVIENDFHLLPKLIADANPPAETIDKEVNDGQDPKQLTLF